MKKIELSEKLFLCSSFHILLVATILSFILSPAENTIIPYPRVVIPIVNMICTTLSCLLLFIPTNIYIEVCILGIQAIATTFTGYEILGLFLFLSALILLFCDGFFKSNAKRKVSICIVMWMVVIIGVIPLGIDRYILVLASTFFFIGFYYFVYSKLKGLLKPLIPQKNISSCISLPLGASFILKDLEFSDRQIQILKIFYEENLNYNEIADKLILSTSLVKKEMSVILKRFEVKKSRDLFILLHQYNIIF